MKNIYLKLLIFFLMGFILNINAKSNNKLLLYSKNKQDILLRKNCSNKSIIFEFKDFQSSKSSIICINNDIYNFINNNELINIVYFFKISNNKYLEQLLDFEDLKKKYKKNIFFTNIVMGTKSKISEIQKIFKRKSIKLFTSTLLEENKKLLDFISFKFNLKSKITLPLIALFVNGKYFTHYEGSIFREMIESDLNQIQKKILK